jgi:hypothetical protein
MVIGCRFPKEIGIGTVRHLGRNSLPHARLFSFEGTALRVGAPQEQVHPVPVKFGLIAQLVRAHA